MLPSSAFLGMLFNLILFFMIGFWPAYWLCTSSDRLVVAAAIAPTMGFAITSLLATYLVLMDLPVRTWSGAYVILFMLMGGGILLYQILRKRAVVQDFFLKQRELIWLIAGILIITLVLALPMLLGGVNFTTLRGNSYDDVYYMSMGGYLDREPYSWIKTATTSAMIAKDGSYPLVAELLNGRWSTAAVLALTSDAAGLPIYRFEYAYTLLFFIMAFGPSFLLGRLLKLGRSFAFCAAAVICTGFWAQVVLDMRAFSEINSIPLMLSICYLTLDAVGQNRIQIWREPTLLGILAASLIFSYAEIVPLLVLGLVIFLGLLLFKRALRIDHLKAALYVFALTVLGIAPLMSHLTRFASAAFAVAANAVNNWQNSYFLWLYSNPLIGFWGLTPYTAFFDHPSVIGLSELGKILLMISGGVLFLVALSTAIQTVTAKDMKTHFYLVVSLVCAALVEFLFLLIRGQLWAAGKSLAYAYPFFILMVAAAVLNKDRPLVAGPRIVSNGVLAVTALWVLSQMALGLGRINVAITGTEFANYSKNLRDYRAYDYDLSPITAALANEKPATIWTVLPDSFLEQFINLALGADHHIVDTLGVRDHDNNLIGVQDMNQLPEYILAYRSALQDNPSWHAYTIAGNADLVLLRVPKERFFFYSLNGASGPGKWQGKRVAWIGADKTFVRVISSGYSQLRFSATFMPGPSLPDPSQGKLQVLDPITGAAQVYLIRDGEKEFVFDLKTGETDIAFSDLDIPTGTDPRASDTLLAMTKIKLEPLADLSKPAIP